MTLEEFRASRQPSTIAAFEEMFGGERPNSKAVTSYCQKGGYTLYILETDLGFEWMWGGHGVRWEQTLAEAEKQLWLETFA